MRMRAWIMYKCIIHAGQHAHACLDVADYHKKESYVDMNALICDLKLDTKSTPTKYSHLILKCACHWCVCVCVCI